MSSAVNRKSLTHSQLYPLTTIVEPLDLAKLFPKAQPLEVELGAGDGTFLMDWARLHPDINYIGVERLLGRARKIGRKSHRAGLFNLRAVRIEGSYFLKYLLPPRSAHAIHVYFPDPWPKRRHWKRRLVNTQFTHLAADALKPCGTVYLRTDDADYFEQIKAAFQENPRFRATPTPDKLSAILTDFERDFHGEGKPTLRAAYDLVG